MTSIAIFTRQTEDNSLQSNSTRAVYKFAVAGFEPKLASSQDTTTSRKGCQQVSKQRRTALNWSTWLDVRSYQRKPCKASDKTKHMMDRPELTMHRLTKRVESICRLVLSVEELTTSKGAKGGTRNPYTLNPKPKPSRWECCSE